MRRSYRQLDRTFWKKLISIAIPVSLQSMLFSLLGVIDIFMVSQLGETATAAVGVGNRIFFFNLLLVVGVSGAVGVLASQYFGAGNMAGIRRSLAQSWVIASLFTFPFILLYFFAPEAVVSFVSSDPEYVELATNYLWVAGISLIGTALVVPLESALRSIGEAKLPTYISIIAVVINVILNALLIFGLFGFPELGVVGAGIGTSISRLIKTVLLFTFVQLRYQHIFPTKLDWQSAKQADHLRLYTKIAWPMTLHDASWAAGLIVYNIIVGQLGMTELAIISFLSPIEGLFISIFIGFSVAASVLLGQELGANNFDRAEQQSWWFVIIGCLLALLLALLCFAVSPFLEQLLQKVQLPDSELALNVCLVMAFGMVLRVFNMVGIAGVLKSGGDINYSIFIDLFGQWAIGIPLAYFTGIVLGWPLHWVLLIVLLEEVIKIALTTKRIQSRRWIKNLIQSP